MPGINNNLYPPIFKKSYAPAFVGTCKIYFSISIYNSYAQINKDCAQIVVQNQKTNQSVLKRSVYPSGIKISTITIDNTVDSDEKYYIEINSNDIEGGFNFNEYYKVQIRFTSSNVKDIPTSSVGIDAWLNRNLTNFSQWSTVVLIKPISKPILSLKNFNFSASSTTTITTNHLTVMGTVSPTQTGDYQDYKSYKILIYSDSGELLEDSGDLYFINSNQIQYNCKYNFQSEESYILKVQILTRNLYFMESTANFDVNYIPYTTFDAIITGEIDNKNACAIVTLKNEVLVALGTNIVIRRASSKDNFHYWDDVYTTLIPANTMIDFQWKDYTIENGVWYKYSAVKRNKENFRSTAVEMEDPIMADFEDIFLTTGKQQLKIRFDPQITNYSRVVSESLTETIGSKYPFIRRNGNINYRTFSIAGTISYFSDIEQNLMHASRQETYGAAASLYENYNQQNNINLFNDVIQEKVFREKVLDFLYQNNVKLYKSATQGNLLVKLMNISLTPNATLDRRIYSFTCTAYEIDEFTYENCVKYGIQTEGQFVDQNSLFIERYGQVIIPSQDEFFEDGTVIPRNNYFGSQNLLPNLIKQKYSNLETDEIQIDINKLTYLKITLTSDPYLIGSSNGQPYRIANTSDNSNNAICSGHIAIINGEYIVIKEDGIYQLSDDDTSITSLSFVYPNEQGTLDFQVSIEEIEKNDTDIVKQYSMFSRIGQIWGNFDISKGVTQSIYSQIVNKYAYSDSNYEQQVQKISGLRIYAEPGTTVYVRERQDRGYDKHVLNDTGLLEFYDDDTDIKGIYFGGPELIQVSKKDVEEKGLQPYEFYDSKEVITFDSIKNPKNNYVYYVLPFDPNDSSTLIIPEQQLEEIEENLYLNQLIQKKMTYYIWNINKQYGEKLVQNININFSDDGQGNIVAVGNPEYINFLDNGNGDIIITGNPKYIIFSDKGQGNINAKVNKEILGLGLKYSSYQRYIFYNGTWYPFTNQNTLIVSHVEAIIDYYCNVLRRRY